MPVLIFRHWLPVLTLQDLCSAVCSVILLSEYTSYLCPKYGAGVCHVFACSVGLQTFREEFTRVLTSYMPGFLFFLLKESGHLGRNRKKLDPETAEMWAHPHPGMRIQTWKASVNAVNTAEGQTQKLCLPPTSPEENLTNMKIGGLDK